MFTVCLPFVYRFYRFFGFWLFRCEGAQALVDPDDFVEGATNEGEAVGLGLETLSSAAMRAKLQPSARSRTNVCWVSTSFMMQIFSVVEERATRKMLGVAGEGDRRLGKAEIGKQERQLQKPDSGRQKAQKTQNEVKFSSILCLLRLLKSPQENKDAAPDGRMALT
jgi:hypothetical protein